MGLLIMKRIGNIYNNLYDLNNIISVYNKIKCNTKNKYKIEQFDDYFCINIVNIYNVLKENKYKVGKYNLFIIYEPKQRLILNQDLFNKIINHLVGNELINILENSLIDSNVAVRVNKGTSYGVKLVKKYIKNLNYNYYCLKIDIKKYFYSINHNILKDLLSKKIKDKLFLNILYKIIDSSDEDYILEYAKKHNIGLKKGYSLPIGNLTSQILGIYYLNDLDHYIKEELKIKYYIRYVDDMVLFHKDKEYLKYCLDKIKLYLKKYDLELNNKTIITKNSLCFLGYRFYNKNIKILSKNRRRIYKKLRILKDKDYDKYIKSLNSYYGYFKIQKY